MNDCMVKKERVARGWTQAALAARCGCVPSAVANIECGCRLPSLRLAMALAGALDLSLAAMSAACVARHESWCAAHPEAVGAVMTESVVVAADEQLDTQ